MNINHFEDLLFWDRFVESSKIIKANPNHPILENYQQIKDGVNSRADNGDTPIMLASKIGHSEAIIVLLEIGADIDAKNVKGITALMWAAHRGQKGAVSLLLKMGANINIQNNEGGTALMVVSTGKAESSGTIVKMLLEKGANVNLKTIHGSTALAIAVENNQVEIVKMLLDGGADANATGPLGYSILRGAKVGTKLTQLFTRGKIISMLKQYGAIE